MLANLKALRTAQGLSQRALADFVKVSQQSINQYENRDTEPDIAVLTRIADYFGVSIDEKLASLFLTIGIPAHIKGYQFLRTAVKMVVDNPDMINRITKELYPSIGKCYNTSASKVERAIRHAIEVAWSRGRIDTLNKAFGCRVATKEDKPTNGEFIAMLADKLSLEQRSAS